MVNTGKFTKNHVFNQMLFMIGKIIHSDLIHQIEYLTVENKILRSKLGKQVRTSYGEKLRLLKFGLPLGGTIKNLISIVNYTTFRRWANECHSNNLKKRSKLGRPRKTHQEIIDIIIRMAKENLDWGYGRIMGELKKLGIKRGRTTIKRIMLEHGLDPTPKRYVDSWDAYIKRSFETLWACDFFSKTVWTPFGKKMLWALFFINIKTREVHIAGVDQYPNKEWILKCANNMSGLFLNDDSSKLLIRDADGKYPDAFDEVFKKYNTNVKTIPYRSPNLNPYAEAWVGTIKRECLEKFFIFGKAHFEHLIKEYVEYYNTQRPHSGIDNDIPYSTNGIQSNYKLSGVLKNYYLVPPRTIQ